MPNPAAAMDSIESSEGIQLRNSAELIHPRGHYSHVAIHQGLAYVSGQLPTDQHGTCLTDQPFDIQARQVLHNLDLCLAAAGTARPARSQASASSTTAPRSRSRPSRPSLEKPTQTHGRRGSQLSILDAGCRATGDTRVESLTVLTMGGTIDKIYNLAGELEIGPPAAHEILEVARVGLPVTVEAVVARDSLDLTDADRELLLRRISQLHDSRAVITHGTDTMSETADFLQRHVSDIAGKTLVITGAMQPGAMRLTDAPFNLGAALVAAQTQPAGVYICMNGRVIPAGSATKDRTSGQFVTSTD